MRNFTAVILVFCLMISFLASCSGSPEQTKADNYVTSGVSETTAAELIPNLPDTDMEGEIFNVGTPGWFGFTPLEFIDIVSEEQNGEILNDAVFNRKILTEDKYNCIIQQTDVTDINTYTAELTKAVLAADELYDIAYIRGMNLADVMSKKILLDLDEIPSINFDMPWWDKASYDSLGMAGNNYVICSDFTTNNLLSIWSAFFNKKMRDNYTLENPYDLVKDGKWTYDNLFEMCAAVSSDIDGDGKITKNDRFGMTHTLDSVMGMFNSMDVYIAKNNADSIPVITVDNIDSLSKITKLYEKLFVEEQVFNIHRKGTPEEEIFMAGRSLFCFSGIYLTEMLRSMDDEFGILPYPKYDEAQSNYIPSNNAFCMSLIAVPVTNSKLEHTGIIMEEYSYQGYKNVRPMFYDVILQGKVVRDEESAEILDYIFGNVGYDIGSIFNFNSFAYDLFYLTLKLDTNISSFLASKQPSAQLKIDEMVSLLQQTD